MSVVIGVLSRVSIVFLADERSFFLFLHRLVNPLFRRLRNSAFKLFLHVGRHKFDLPFLRDCDAVQIHVDFVHEFEDVTHKCEGVGFGAVLFIRRRRAQLVEVKNNSLGLGNGTSIWRKIETEP